MRKLTLQSLVSELMAGNLSMVDGRGRRRRTSRDGWASVSSNEHRVHGWDAKDGTHWCFFGAPDRERVQSR